MASQFVFSPSLGIDELEAYHRDIEAALRFYFSPSAPDFSRRFVGRSRDEIDNELSARLVESDVRSVFMTLTSLEASFRGDFDFRCTNRLKDPLSVRFRTIKKARRDKVRLDEDILESWREHSPAIRRLIGELRGAFKFRHWLAHGRYWTTRPGRHYDFAYVHLMATAIVTGFPFVS